MKQHLKTSAVYIRRAPFQAMAAISVLAVTFFVSTLIAVLAYSSDQVIRYFETRPQIIAFMKEDAQDSAIKSLQSRLLADERVKSVNYVTKEDALSIYKDATSDNPLLGELVSPSIFPASLEFSVVNLEFAEGVIDEIKGEDIVDSVTFTASLGGESSLGDVIQRLKTISLYIRVGGLVAVAVLAFTSFLVLMVVIGMRITTRRSEIDSLSLIGATPWFIRAPILFEAIGYSVMGVIFGWLMAAVLVMYTTPSILSYFGEIPVLPSDSLMFFALLAVILAGEMFVGLMIAVVGSSISVSRSLGKKRK